LAWATSSSRRRRARALAAALLLGAAAPATAVVFHSQEEALALAFPDAERVSSRVHILSEEEVHRVERLSRAPLESKLAKLYTGWRGEEVLGYAYIDVHTVRTLPEALLIVLAPDGSVRSVRTLAFHEPLDYLPTEPWYRQFEGAKPGEVQGILGATLTSRAVTDSVRRTQALYQVLIRGRRPDGDG
jgi:hypothetical protein